MHNLISSVVQGFPIGCVFALVAVGFVLTYKVSGVFNLAFGAQAYVAAAMYYELRVNHGWPIPPAVAVAVLVVSPALGVLLYFGLYRYLRTAAPVARLVVSIGLLVALPEIVKLVLHFGDAPKYGVQGIVGNGSTRYEFFSYAVDRNQLATILVTLGLVVGLTLMFRYSTIGLRMRSVVESARMTELAGVSADHVSSFGWALSSALAGIAGVLLGPLYPQLAAQNFFLLIVVAIAAAALADLSSLPLALVGGLALGIGAQILSRYLPTNSVLATGLRPSLPFVALFLVLILKPSLQRKREFADPLAGVDPPPPALAGDGRGAALVWGSRGFSVAVCVIASYWFLFVGNAYWLSLATQTLIFAIIFLSITVFTGMAGQISLAQGVFAAIGAFTCGQLAERWGTSVFVGLLLGIVIAVAVATLLAIPALRLGGIYLALATLAFAMFFETVIVKLDWAGGGLLPVKVPRPVLGPVDFTSDKSFYGLCAVALVLAAFVVVQTRNGTTGRTLRAVAGSDVAASSIGINPTRARVTAFALSAGLASVGGALLAMREGAANYAANYSVQFGLFWLVIVVTLSPRTVDGAIQAAFALKFFPELLKNLHFSASWQFVLFGLGAVMFARHPEGLLEHGKRMTFNRIQALLDRRAGGQHVETPATTVEMRDPSVVAYAAAAAPANGERADLLVARSIRVEFSGILAVDGVDLVVREHELVGLIGPNGAGKTTLFNCLSGTLRPQGGSVHFAGKPVGRMAAYRRARLGLARTFQRVELFPGMSPRDHLLLAERARRRNGALWKDVAGRGAPTAEERAAVDATIELLGLAGDADRPIESLSLGGARLVEVGRALMTEPRLLLLDEPSSGLDRRETAALTEVLRLVHRERGTAVLLVEHDVDMVSGFVERMYVLDFGTLIAEGPTAAVFADPKVRDVYLGEQGQHPAAIP
jgi:ABC-type branched-subunit amino acid transport system ATPase component/branched-subunit amino acid ABC-type transport system permease component